jgi:hypothetical protein
MAITLQSIPRTVDQLNSINTDELRNALATVESTEVELFLKTFSSPPVSSLTFKQQKKITKALPPSTPPDVYCSFFDFHIRLRRDWEPVLPFFRSSVLKNYHAAELLLYVIDDYGVSIPSVALEEQLLEAFEKRAIQKAGADKEVDNKYISALISLVGKISYSYPNPNPILSAVCRWGTLEELMQLCEIYKARAFYPKWDYSMEKILDIISNNIEKLKVLLSLFKLEELKEQLDLLGGTLILKAVQGSPTNLNALIKYLKSFDISVSEKIKVTLNPNKETALHVAIRNFGPYDLRARLLKLCLTKEDVQEIFRRKPIVERLL